MLPISRYASPALFVVCCLMGSAQVAVAGDDSLTGSYAIEAVSKNSPNCRGAGEIRILQQGTAITGEGSISGNCIGGPHIGTIKGSYDGSQLKIIFYSDFSYSFYSESETMLPNIIYGAYGSLGANDAGIATLKPIE